MTKDGSRQNAMHSQTATVESVSDSLFFQIQANISRLIDLQQGQQGLVQRFLDIQERFITAKLGGEVQDFSTSSVKETSEQPKPAAASLQTQAAPPVPVLPKLAFAPSAEASNATAEAPSPVVPTLVKPAGSVPPQSLPGAGVKKGPATAEEFQADLVHAVSERTGYPEEMLDLDAHMEADLGIDSIKRIEIYTTLNEHHDLLGGREEETVLEELAGLKTLRRIVEWYDANRARALKGGGSSKKA